MNKKKSNIKENSHQFLFQIIKNIKESEIMAGHSKWNNIKNKKKVKKMLKEVRSLQN